MSSAPSGPKPRIRIRCDAGSRHGLGHLSRQLTLAAAFRAAGGAVDLVVNAPPEIMGRITAAGHAVAAAQGDVGSDDPDSWLLPGLDLAVIDSKEISADYGARARAHCPLACFEDEVARDLPCDAIINNNVWANAADYSPTLGRSLLLGPRFNTVQASYFTLVGTPRHGILITLGGEDPLNHTSWLIEHLAALLARLPVHVCIGPAHPDAKAVIRAAERHVPHSVVHLSPSSLLEPARRCHIALSAGGTTCYELAAAGMAMAVLAVEDHQTRMLRWMCASGASLALGRYDTLTEAGACKTLEQLLDVTSVARLSAAAHRLFPAPGVAKIVDSLMPLALARAYRRC